MSNFDNFLARDPYGDELDWTRRTCRTCGDAYYAPPEYRGRRCEWCLSEASLREAGVS